MIDISLDDKETAELPPGIYSVAEKYEGVPDHEVSIWDIIPPNVVIRRDVPAYAMDGGNIRGMTPKNQGAIYLSPTWGDEDKAQEVGLHEWVHNYHPGGHEELATRKETARLLHNLGKDTGTHSQYLH